MPNLNVPVLRKIFELFTFKAHVFLNNDNIFLSTKISLTFFLKMPGMMLKLRYGWENKQVQNEKWYKQIRGNSYFFCGAHSSFYNMIVSPTKTSIFFINFFFKAIFVFYKNYKTLMS